MRIGIVVQRYGEYFSGGAEEHARVLAKKLCKENEVEVITTCATDYTTWANELSPGTELMDGVLVRRFSTDFEREKKSFDKKTDILLSGARTIIDEVDWLVHQGPYSTLLFRFLEDNSDSYDYLIFYTYLYITTVFGMMIAPHKSLFIPTAHDEQVINFKIFSSVFHLPRGIFYLTEEERSFAQQRFQNSHIPSTMLGIGIDPPVAKSSKNFREKFGIKTPYILYLGRVDEGKGCRELVDYFIRYMADEPGSDITLVFAGKQHMEKIDHSSVVMTGYISEAEKGEAFFGADLVVSPSQFESLSILVLDAFNNGIPILANSKCKVVQGHCQRSGAGLLYGSYPEFQNGLKMLVSDSDKKAEMGKSGEIYIDQHFRWPLVLQRFQSLINMLGID